MSLLNRRFALSALPVRPATALLALVLVLVWAGASGCATARSKLYDQAMKKQRRDAGFKSGEVQVMGHRVPYLERDPEQAETVLLLHGFSANKDTWLTPFLDAFKGRFHVVVPDLPGFGDATYKKSERYTVEKQVERIVAFMADRGIDKAHVMGNSMGGLLALALAAEHPALVQSLSLLAPAGVPGAQPSPFQKAVDAGEDNWLIVHDDKSLDRMLKTVFVTPIKLPTGAKPVLVNEYKSREAQHRAIFDQLTASGWDAGALIAKIGAPTLIVWGDSDKVLDPSGAPALFAALPEDAKRVAPAPVVLERCGHMPQLEKPFKSSTAVMKFLLALPAAEATPAIPPS